MIPHEPKEIVAQLQQFLQRIRRGRFDPSLVRPEARFVEDLGLDSLDLMEIRFDIESAWNVSVEDQEAQNLKTVGDIIALVQQRRVSGSDANRK
jgi:acyl carrier protein